MEKEQRSTLHTPAMSEIKTYERERERELKLSLLRACSSSAALRAAGLHTHVRTHRTSSDPAYLIKSGLLVHFREERNVAISGV